MAEFSEISLTLNKKLSKETRKEQGIYFTPKSAREHLFNTLPSSFTPKTILEPSFGSGEFIDHSAERWPTSTIDAVELNQENFREYLPKKPKNTFLYNKDFTTWTPPRAYDLIIGNPPYFVTEKKIPECMTGRPNIYVEFLYKSLLHLAPNGILSFIIPTSILNSSYYQPMRDILVKKNILCVKKIDGKFYDTAQKVVILTVQNSEPVNNNFSIQINCNWYLSEAAEELRSLLSNSKTLKQLGFSVKTGEVVWNQVSHIEGVSVQKKDAKQVQKGNLVSSDEDAVFLYYSHNVAGRLSDKPQYVKGFQKEANKGPAILVNRGYGNSFSLELVRVPHTQPFYAENHVNVIKGPSHLLDTVEKSLGSEKTKRFIEAFIGNGGLSKTELEEVLPIFL